MELRHLRYIIAVAEELHFGHAAKRLNMSQPPLSQQIMQLEEELGVKLFDRNKRQVRLTEAGRVFVEGARLALNQAERMTMLTVLASRGDVGHLTIGVSSVVDPTLIATILRTFVRRYPGTRLLLRNVNTATQIQMLRSEELDVGFLMEPVADPSLVVETIRREEMIVALPDIHPLAARRSLPITALAGQPCIMFSRSMSPAYYDAILAFCRNAGFSLDIVHDADNIHTTLMLVGAGLGISLLPPHACGKEYLGIVFRKIQGPGPQRIVGLACKRGAIRPAVQMFVDVVREVAAVKKDRRASLIPMP